MRGEGWANQIFLLWPYFTKIIPEALSCGINLINIYIFANTITIIDLTC